MSPQVYITALVALGFAPASLRDELGYDPPGCTYLTRSTAQDQHQWVSIMESPYDGRFLEAQLTVYVAPKPRLSKRLPHRQMQERGMAPVYANLYRGDPSELIAAVVKRYELPPLPEKAVPKAPK